jgi:aminoglycoside phosphotransferase family enzyme
MKRVKADKILSEMPMAFRAEEALKKAVAKAIADHKRTGDPIVVWRDGKVARIPAHEIEIREPGAEYTLSDREDE